MSKGNNSRRNNCPCILLKVIGKYFKVFFPKTTEPFGI